MLTSDLARARMLAQRVNARLGRPMPWTAPFPAQCAAGAEQRDQLHHLGTGLWSTDLEKAVREWCRQRELDRAFALAGAA